MADNAENINVVNNSETQHIDQPYQPELPNEISRNVIQVQVPFSISHQTRNNIEPTNEHFNNNLTNLISLNYNIHNVNNQSGSDSSSESSETSSEVLGPLMNIPYMRNNIRRNAINSNQNRDTSNNEITSPLINRTDDYFIENNYFDHFYNTDNLINHRRNNLIQYEICDETQELLVLKLQKKKYGKLAVNFFHKLIKNNLIKATQMNLYTIKKMYKLYFTNFKLEKAKEKNSYKMTRKFFNCLIGISQLERFINTINFQDKTNQNDIFFLKIFMGVYQHFYLEFDYPLFDNYHKKFLKLAINFHEKLTEDNIIFIEEKLTLFSYEFDNSLHNSVHRNIATFFQKKYESIDHYTNEIKRITNLTNGVNKSTFVI